MAKSARSKSQSETRDQRKTQILDAARICVRDHGIHAATLNRIAALASMSGGHVYHFFATKEALMIALCDRDLDDFMMHMSQFTERARVDPGNVAEALSAEIMAWFSQDRAALTIEFVAEAGRNPNFLEMVLRNEGRMREAIHSIMGPLLVGLPEPEIKKRVETLLVMMRGLAGHACTRPKAEYGVLAETFEIVLRGVLTLK
ncbi:TetR/AcrR family transcriptional regulator [Sphingobium sp. AN558]|uniref:TetR/AcrR family transcriptional regulator n=1 Tax=Sphingobium sp. AN558 TaxID=3133442 RepID=UPI0030C02272